MVYLVYKYEVTENRGNKINLGPIIIGLFDEIQENKYKYKELNTENIDLTKKLYVLMEFNGLFNENSSLIKIHGIFNNVANINISTLKNACYTIFSIKLNEKYPYGKESLCWIDKPLFFDTLFIRNNTESLIEFIKKLKNNS